MKPHDRIPDAETLRGLDDWYKPIGIDAFLLDTPNILTTDQVIVAGHTYLLFDYSQGQIINVNNLDIIESQSNSKTCCDDELLEFEF